MTSFNDSLALVFEVLTWLGLVAGIALLAVGYGIRIFAARFIETWGVVILSPSDSERLAIRWMDLDRTLHTRPLPDHAPAELGLGDEVTVHFERREPSRARLDDPRRDGRGVRISGWLLVAIGVVSAIVQIVATFSE